MDKIVAEHRGAEIVLSGISFTCVLPGKKRLTAPSVDALKKKIDAALKDDFQPFKAVQIDHGFRRDWAVREVMVVERTAEKRRGHAYVTFTVESEGRRFNVSPDRLYPLEEKAAVVAYVNARNAERKRAEEAEERLHVMDRALKKVDANV